VLLGPGGPAGEGPSPLQREQAQRLHCSGPEGGPNAQPGQRPDDDPGGDGGASTPFKEIVARLAEHRVSAVPVVDHDQRVLGVVSEADLLLKEEFPYPDLDLPLWWTKRNRLERAKAAASVARDLMTVAVVAIAPEATAAEAARRMHTAGVKRLPVVEGPAGRDRQPGECAEGVRPLG
jgi:hypothetical protein